MLSKAFFYVGSFKAFLGVLKYFLFCQVMHIVPQLLGWCDCVYCSTSDLGSKIESLMFPFIRMSS